MGNQQRVQNCPPGTICNQNNVGPSLGTQSNGGGNGELRNSSGSGNTQNCSGSKCNQNNKRRGQNNGGGNRSSQNGSVGGNTQNCRGSECNQNNNGRVGARARTSSGGRSNQTNSCFEKTLTETRAGRRITTCWKLCGPQCAQKKENCPGEWKLRSSI